MKTLKEHINELTLKKLISETKRLDTNYGFNTKISVYITSVDNDGKSHIVKINPDSDNFIDRHGMIAFDDCTVSDFNTYEISKKDYLLIIIVDLNDQ